MALSLSPQPVARLVRQITPVTTVHPWEGHGAMDAFGISLLMFVMGGWLIVMGLRLVRIERRQRLERGIQPEPFLTITPILGLAMVHLGWINLAALWLVERLGPQPAGVSLAIFLLEALAALALARGAFWLIERYLPRWVN